MHKLLADKDSSGSKTCAHRANLTGQLGHCAKRRPLYLIALLGSAMFGLASCGASSTNVASHGSTTSTPSVGLSYFKGKTITFIAPDKPGAQDDALMRVISAGMAKYLHCTVKVTNIPQGNTMPGQDAAASSAPNGLTIGYLNVASDLDAKVSGKPSVNFDITGVQLLGSPSAPMNVMVSNPSSPYTRIQDVINSKSTVDILEPTSGGATTAVKALTAAYGVNFKLVTGYANSGALVQGFLRGDGPVTDTAEKPLMSAISAGKARPILQLGSADTSSPIASKLANVPTLQQLFKEDPPTSSKGKQLMAALINYRSIPQQWLFVPAQTKSSIVAVLRQAMQAAFAMSSVKKSLIKLALPTGFTPGTQGLQDVKLMQAAVPTIAKYS